MGFFCCALRGLAEALPAHAHQADFGLRFQISGRKFLENPAAPALPIFALRRLKPGASTSKLRILMRDVKDTLRALVRIGYDGRVQKTFRGPKAGERFANEVRVLRHLEDRGCGFVPRLLEVDPAQLRIVTTNCGSRVEHLDQAKVRELFAELLPYGVRHDDPDKRNVTYRQSDGRFCLIDFEFATILPDSPKPDDGPPR
jgi:hypothetical protein